MCKCSAYRDGAAQAHGFPHNKLWAGLHEHLLRRAHHHHAPRWLHSQNPGSFEHVGERQLSRRVEWRGVERGREWALCHKNVGEAQSASLDRSGISRVANWLCGGPCAESVRSDHRRLHFVTTFSHQPLPQPHARSRTHNTCKHV